MKRTAGSEPVNGTVCIVLKKCRKKPKWYLILISSKVTSVSDRCAPARNDLKKIDGTGDWFTETKK